MRAAEDQELGVGTEDEEDRPAVSTPAKGLSLLDMPLEVVEQVLLPFDLRQRVRICCASRRLLQLANTSHRLWAELGQVWLDSAEQAERFLKWLAGKQHLVRSLHLEQGEGPAAEAGGGEEEEEGEARPKAQSELPRHILFVLGMLAGGPLTNLSWSIRGAMAVRSWMFSCLPALQRLSLRCLDDAPGTIALGRDLSRLTSLTELVVAHGATDASLEGVVFPASLRSLGLSPVTAELPEAVAAATHLRQLSISNVDMLVDSPPGPELHGLDSLVLLTSLSLNFCQLSALPEELAALTNLVELSISNTNFYGGGDPLVPVLALTRLTKLLCAECELPSVPSELWRLPALQALDLGFNPLDELNFQNTEQQPLALQHLCISPAVAALNASKLATLTALPNLYLRGSIPDLDVQTEALEALLAVLLELPGLTRLSFAECFVSMMGRSVGLFLGFAGLSRRRPDLQLIDADITPIGPFDSSWR